MLDRLIESIVNCEVKPIEKRGVVYHYAILPTTGIPRMEAALFREIGCAMVRKMDLEKVDMIVVPEAMGIPIGTTLSLMTDIPLNVIRKRQYGLPGECVIRQTTGYSEEKDLYINGLGLGMRVVVVDDVLSTGGTMRAVLAGLASIQVEVVDVCVVIKRGDPDIGRDYNYLVEIEVTDRVQVIGVG